MKINYKIEEIEPIKKLLEELKRDGKVLIAILYGSYAKGSIHKNSDIDLALYINTKDIMEDIKIVDRILMSVERNVSILRLDDEDESPFVVQNALKGVYLIEPNREILYLISNRVLHECESIRFRKKVSHG